MTSDDIGTSGASRASDDHDTIVVTMPRDGPDIEFPAIVSVSVATFDLHAINGQGIVMLLQQHCGLSWVIGRLGRMGLRRVVIRCSGTPSEQVHKMAHEDMVAQQVLLSGSRIMLSISDPVDRIVMAYEIARVRLAGLPSWFCLLLNDPLDVAAATSPAVEPHVPRRSGIVVPLYARAEPASLDEENGGHEDDSASSSSAPRPEYPASAAELRQA
ncbi:hypothetical protein C8A03DRAFT_37837 [Achaetomium macrosporum]|uniref:Uncharacterized protein n=1 Tax=Achaetomium macrosporum TaxID=79813 RepID=A0AAN7C3L9_9PEZI|nr:hypothetical protein C8A03DRAFT_37837 [Achaetomium macrosporum]